MRVKVRVGVEFGLASSRGNTDQVRALLSRTRVRLKNVTAWRQTTRWPREGFMGCGDAEKGEGRT